VGGWGEGGGGRGLKKRILPRKGAVFMAQRNSRKLVGRGGKNDCEQGATDRKSEDKKKRVSDRPTGCGERGGGRGGFRSRTRSRRSTNLQTPGVKMASENRRLR